MPIVVEPVPQLAGQFRLVDKSSQRLIRYIFLNVYGLLRILWINELIFKYLRISIIEQAAFLK